MAESHKGSLTDMVFDKLESDIITGVLAQGEILSENMLSAKLGVSRTPVREALGRLEQDGLVAASAHGLKVIGVSQQDLYDIYDIRLRIEGLAAKYACECMSNEQLKEMTSLVELQEYYVSKGDSTHIRDIDSQFHAMIYSACEHRVLAETLRSLHHKIERFRALSVCHPERAFQTISEHRAILEAIRERDSLLAEKLLIEHIINARAAMCELPIET